MKVMLGVLAIMFLLNFVIYDPLGLFINFNKLELASILTTFLLVGLLLRLYHYLKFEGVV